MSTPTWRATCPHCKRLYIGRAFTAAERDNPGLHLLTFKPILCGCGRTYVASQVNRWEPERL